MNVIEGPVQRLRLGTEVSGSHDQVQTTHVATFQLGKTPVRLEMPRAILLAEGDPVRVAGAPGKDGVFAALAYQNRDNGARGQACGPMHLLLGVVFTAVGLGATGVVLVMLLQVLGGDTGALAGAGFASIFMLAFGGFGIGAVRKYLQTRSAAAALR